MSNASPAPPRSAKYWIVNAVVSSAILGASIFGYTLLGERVRPPRVKPPKAVGIVVSTESLRPHAGPISIAANGVVIPTREIRLATEVPGRIVELSENVRAGRMVEKGETLIKLDAAQFEIEVRRLKSQQAQETAELTVADVNIENTKQLLYLAEEQVALANAERARAESLVARQAASAAEVDVAKRAELISKAALVELQNRRREFVAQRDLTAQKQSLTNVSLERANLDLDRTTIQSPIRGRVVQSTVEEQSYVAAGTPFVTIEDTSSVEVRCNLTVEQMYWVWNAAPRVTNGSTGDDVNSERVPPVPASIQYRLGSRVYQWQAILERIDGAGIDVNTRTYPCLFRVNDPEDVTAIATAFNEGSNDGPRRLMRGMFVSVTLQAESKRSLYQIPELAIRPGNRVWLNVEGMMRIMPIEIVSRVDDSVVIDGSPLERLLGIEMIDAPSIENVSVVTSPVSEPRDGMVLVSQPPRGVAGEQRGDSSSETLTKKNDAIESDANAAPDKNSSAETSKVSG